MWSLFIIYISLVVGVTLFPIPYKNGITFQTSAMNFIPFRTISETIRNNDSKQIFLQLFGNIIMFFPLGILLKYLHKGKKGIENLIIALGMAFFIELLQGIIGIKICGYLYRSVDIDDVILNTTGYLTGYVFYKVMPRRVTKIFEFTD